MEIDEMVEGQRYRVVWRSDSHRKDHAFIADFIGFTNWDAFFSFRPAAGTSQIRKSFIKSVELRDKHQTPITYDKVVG